jgi:hypothetical protein
MAKDRLDANAKSSGGLGKAGPPERMLIRKFYGDGSRRLCRSASTSRRLSAQQIAVNDYEVFKGYKPGADRKRADEYATEQYARFLVRLRKEDVRAIR